MALDAGESGITPPVAFRFTSLPSNAEVRTVKIDPGNPIINNNNHNMMGSVIFNTIEAVLSDNKTVTSAWNPRNMEISQFIE